MLRRFMLIWKGFIAWMEARRRDMLSERIVSTRNTTKYLQSIDAT
jgi:hypothetical protein